MNAEIVPFRIEVQTDGEARISDIELAKGLGYVDIRVFRRLIKNHVDNLSQLDDVFSKRIVPSGGGKAATAYFLTEHQALFMISRSDMPVATQIMISVARAFIEMRRNQPVTRDLLRLNILSPEVRVWEKRFEKPFFVNLHRVLGLAKTGRNNHPNCGHFINRYVYDFLFGEIGLEV
ncbi:P63C domain-containing protein, partial [Asaia sp. VD9]|uniref:P63C domain-containing protein n=1 Tax=Asaia sp. VD9 TaxID=3081235 RepID=UPI00301AD1A5